MHIPINKDPEEAYKEEVIRGFTMREAAHLAAAFGLMAATAAIVWWKTDLPPDVGVYIGLPLAMAALTLGFKKVQGLTVEQYIKEILYEKKTRILTYEADELPKDPHVFSMESNGKRKGTAKGTRRTWRQKDGKKI